MKRLLAISFLVTAVALCAFAQTKKHSAMKMAAGSAPDKAYMQKIWDGWSTMNPDNVAQFYARGPHTFFDIAPLKYSSWDEYHSGVQQALADFKAAKFTVNDDATINPHGDLAWGTATVKYEMTHKSGKVEMGNMRWTVVWENQDGKWLIVHEHVSEPIQ